MVSLLEKIDDILGWYLYSSFYKDYVEKMNLRGQEKVLEVGCGGGCLSRFLAPKVQKFVCVDRSAYWIRKARKRLLRYENIGLYVCDITEFQAEESFDAIVMHYVLHDIAEDKRLKTLALLYRYLKEGGLLYIREPTRERHGMPAQEIKELMASAGFIEYSGYETSVFPFGRFYDGTYQKVRERLTTD